ncbi:GNAT family N-acetyltransferase [Bacillus timonensis]|nr:GNAT family N-acetyltransferase [Bacillus timonensis]
MNLYQITSITKLEEYREEWNKILRQNANNNPFIELDWVMSWWQFFGDDYFLQVEVLKDEDEILAFFPLMRKKRRFVDEVFFIGYGQANYMDIVVLDEWRELAISYYLQHMNSTRTSVIYHLHGMLKSAGTPDLLEKYLKKERFPFFQGSTISPFINLSAIADLKKYIKPRHSKHGLNRREKRLKTIGEVLYKRLDLNDIDFIFTLHAKRWKDRIDTSGFSVGKTREFYTHLVKMNYSNFQTVVDTLSIEGQMIAFIYGFICGDRYVFYIHAHDDDYGIFSPGRIILKESIVACDEIGLTNFDLSIGYEPYKFDWNNNEDFVMKLVFPTKSLKARFRYFLISRKESLVFALKKNRMIVLFKRNTLGKIRTAFQNIKNEIKRNGLRQLGKFFVSKKNQKQEKFEEFLLYKIKKSPKVNDDHISIKELKLSEVNRIFSAYNLTMEEVIARWYRRHSCYVIEKGTEILGYYWFNQNSIDIPTLPYKENLSVNECFLYDLKAGHSLNNKKDFTALVRTIRECINHETMVVCTNEQNRSLIGALEFNQGSLQKRVNKLTKIE